MALPFVIEYLLAQERPGGGRLVTAGSMQTVAPALPPGFTVTLTYPPPTSIYCQIWFWLRFGASMVPGALSGWYQQAGTLQYGGIAYDVIGNQMDFFIPVTHSEPMIVSGTNNSPLNQFWEAYAGFIEIQTKEDLDLATERIARIGTSARLENLQAETNRLLSTLAGIKQ